MFTLLSSVVLRLYGYISYAYYPGIDLDLGEVVQFNFVWLLWCVSRVCVRTYAQTKVQPKQKKLNILATAKNFEFACSMFKVKSCTHHNKKPVLVDSETCILQVYRPSSILLLKGTHVCTHVWERVCTMSLCMNECMNVMNATWSIGWHRTTSHVTAAMFTMSQLNIITTRHFHTTFFHGMCERIGGFFYTVVRLVRQGISKRWMQKSKQKRAACHKEKSAADVDY